MKHIFQQDDDAKKLLNKAGSPIYTNKSWKPSGIRATDEYLSKLIKQYLEMLDKGEGPAKRKANADH